MLLLLLLLAVVTAAAYYRHSRRRLYQLAREIPSGLKEYPIIGHAYMFVGTNEVLTDAKAIEMSSKTCLDKDEFTTKFMRTVIGYGSIFAPVNIWHVRRKICSPFFNLSNLKNVVKVFDEQSTIMTQLMQSEIGNGDFPIWKYFTMYTFDSVSEIAMGKKINSQLSRNDAITHAVNELTRIGSERLFQPWLHPDFIYKRLNVYQQFQKYKIELDDFVDAILRKKRKEFATVNGKVVNYDQHLTTFIDMMMKNSGGKISYNDTVIREEAIVMVIAGNDSTAVGASFTSVMLSRHPDVQEKVYQELLEVFRDSDRSVTPEDLPLLKYMEAVIKETMRLYPPVPVVVREVHEDVVLPSGTTLVDGSSVMISIWGAHRNPAYWGADADQFRPERFLEGSLPHPAMFIPFSYSMRACTGSAYAMLSMKTALAHLLRRYRLLPPANMAAADLRAPLRVQFDITMKAVDNFVVRVEERNT